MNKPEIRELLIETTRACNMRCAHCLRGEPETRYSSRTIMKALFRNISRVSTLTFTGGEPLLNPSVIRDALDVCKAEGIEVNSVFIATNGTIADNSTLALLREWDEYTLSSCYDRNWDRYVSGYEEIGQVINAVESARAEHQGLVLAISGDPWHEAIPERNIFALSTVGHLTTDKLMDYDSKLVPQGRAVENFASDDLNSGHVLNYDPCYYDDTADTDRPAIDSLYITVTGDIMPDCNLSYDDMDEISHGNVLEANWPEKLLNLQIAFEQKGGN